MLESVPVSVLLADEIDSLDIAGLRCDEPGCTGCRVCGELVSLPAKASVAEPQEKSFQSARPASASSYQTSSAGGGVMDKHPSEILAGLVARWMELAGMHVSFPLAVAEVAAMGDTSKAGLLAAALELRDQLGELPQGRQALSDLGFEPVLQSVEGK